MEPFARRIRLGSVSRATSFERDRREVSDLDGWLETLHGLARGRAAERERLAPLGAEARRRLAGKQ